MLASGGLEASDERVKFGIRYHRRVLIEIGDSVENGLYLQSY